MKINKVDDKPMVIHTKEKSKIHIHESNEAKVKRHNVYMVEHLPESKMDSDKRKRTKNRGKDIFRKNAIHHNKQSRQNPISQYKKKWKDSNRSVKVKDSTIKNTGLLGAGTTLNQLEGGKEVRDSVFIASTVARPFARTASKGASLLKGKVSANRKGKIKRIDAGKKLGRRKTMKATGLRMEQRNIKQSNRNRKIRFFLDKMKSEENRSDGMAKLVKDLIFNQASVILKYILKYVSFALLVLFLLIAVAVFPVVLIIGIIYNSPLALFFPPLESGDTVMTVTSSYEAEFNRDIQTIAENHFGYDDGIVVYVDYEGMAAIPENYYDVMTVYMVKYGVGDTATIMNERSKENLKAVFDDMCSYTTSVETQTVENEDGTPDSKTMLHVNVRLKSYQDMISIYHFNSDEVELLNITMNPENLALIGYTGGTGGGSGGGGNAVSDLSQDEINSLVSGISNETAKMTCSFALTKVGFPYSQAFRDSGNYYDCSSLSYYSCKSAGVDISYGGATTAAAQAQGLEEAGKAVSFEEIQPGDLIFYSYTNNNRYKNISHVAIYIGNGKVVEALNESVGVVYRDMSTGSIVVVARP